MKQYEGEELNYGFKLQAISLASLGFRGCFLKLKSYDGVIKGKIIVGATIHTHTHTYLSKYIYTRTHTMCLQSIALSLCFKGSVPKWVFLY